MEKYLVLRQERQDAKAEYTLLAVDKDFPAESDENAKRIFNQDGFSSDFFQLVKVILP